MIGSIRSCLFLLAVAGTAAAAADSTTIGMGDAVALSLPREASRVVIGNPAIADVTLESPRSLVLFGKYPGGTTLLVSDRSGKPILRTSILVTAADSDGVTIRYGSSKAWVPGGAVVTAACGPDRCATAIPLPPPNNAPPAAPAAAPEGK